VANLEHFDRSRLNSICLSHYDHDWSGIQRLGRTRGGFGGVKEGGHVSGRLLRSPLVYYSDVYPRPRQPIRTHEPSGTSADDEDVYIGLCGHD